jgi:hypothetical protein
MSNYKPRTFTVRGFDPLSINFNKPTGTIESVTGFESKTVRNQVEATATMLTNFKTMTPFVIKELCDEGDINDYAISGVNVPASVDIEQGIQLVDLRITLNTVNKQTIKYLKPVIAETINHWAEKSRVKNLRGWRCSAVKTLSVEYDHDLGLCYVRTQVIISNAVIYSNRLTGYLECSINPSNSSIILDDLGLLRKQLARVLGTNLETVHYKHSLIGQGEVL